jgi:hypothetical protein
MRVIGRAALDAIMVETASSDITPPNTMPVCVCVLLL